MKNFEILFMWGKNTHLFADRGFCAHGCIINLSH